MILLMKNDDLLQRQIVVIDDHAESIIETSVAASHPWLQLKS